MMTCVALARPEAIFHFSMDPAEHRIAPRDKGKLSLTFALWESLVKVPDRETIKQTLDQVILQPPNRDAYVLLIRNCGSARALSEGKQVHELMKKNRYDEELFAGNALIRMYGDCGVPIEARHVFDNMQQHNLFSWNAMLAAYVQHGDAQDAFCLFQQMNTDEVRPDTFLFLNMLSACVTLVSLKKGRAMHAKAVEFGYAMDMTVITSLVKMYDKCRSPEDAILLYFKIENPDLFLSTAIITAYCHHGQGKDAVVVFLQVLESGLKPDRFIMATILNAFYDENALDDGRFIHDRALELGFDTDDFFNAALVNMYGKCGSLEDAQRTFNNLQSKSVVAWNAMLAAYFQNGYAHETLNLFEQMRQQGVQPDIFTFSSLFSACTCLDNLDDGRAFYADLVRAGITVNDVAGSSLITMYGKCNSLDDAWAVFNVLKNPDVMTWNALMSACLEQGCYNDVLGLFELMKKNNIRLNAVSFITILAACGAINALAHGRAIHRSIDGVEAERESDVASALINMYGKCGCFSEALLVFLEIPQPTAVPWNAILAAYAQTGYCKETVQLIEKMLQQGLRPDFFSFLSVLASCSHTGLREEGYHFYILMSDKHGITPIEEHCGCMVDLFGRAGRLVEAESFMKRVLFDHNPTAWRSFLAACKEYGDTGRAKYASEQIIEIDPSSSPGYILLSNAFVDGRHLCFELEK